MPFEVLTVILVIVLHLMAPFKMAAEIPCRDILNVEPISKDIK